MGDRTPSPEHGTVLAYTSEDARFDEVRRRGADLAREHGHRLVLYDVDAAGVFQKPLPTDWSGQGAERQFGDLLGPADLERAGRHALATQVADARAEGIDAWGWLPGDLSRDSLLDYARSVGAGVIVLPRDPGHPGGLLEDLERARPAEVESAAEPLGVEVVEIPSREEAGA